MQNDRRRFSIFDFRMLTIHRPSSVVRLPISTFRNSSTGQAMVEYVIIAGLLMACLGILTVFLVTFKEYGGRILALVSSEYP